MLGRHVHELGQVLDAALRVDGAATAYGDLGLERVPVTGPLEQGLDQLVRRASEEISGPELLEQVEEAPDPGERLS